MHRRNRIAVVGAGLGGLTCAGFLQREGFSVTVYEQAPTFSRIGAGIILSANVMKVLRRLGLERRLLDVGIRPDAFVSRASDTGETLYELTLDGASEARFGRPYINIHRGDLHAVLETALEPGSIAFEHGLTGLARMGEGFELVFANGSRQPADIVIGADGITSKVRESIFGHEPPRFTGRVAHRAIFPAERLRGQIIRDCTKWWGPDRHLLAYFMTPRRDEVYLMGSVPAAAWESEEPSLPLAREEFAAAFAEFHPEIRRVVEAASDVTVMPICDRERNDCWSGDRIVLIGDACHPVRPYMAAGGAMAIEDAAILSRCLATIGDREPAEAFRCYEATRIHRVGKVQQISIANSWLRGPTETDWFFCYDACTAPLAQPT